MNYSAIAIAVAILVGAILFGGRYEIVSSQQGNLAVVFIVDRHFGSATVCIPGGCRKLGPLREAAPGQTGALQ